MRGDLSWFSDVLGSTGSHTHLINSYRNRAEELRAKAEEMVEPSARNGVLNVAADYEQRAEALERDKHRHS
jgi:hypothetical protein